MSKTLDALLLLGSLAIPLPDVPHLFRICAMTTVQSTYVGPRRDKQCGVRCLILRDACRIASLPACLGRDTILPVRMVR